jgi:hypothetical protein
LREAALGALLLCIGSVWIGRLVPWATVPVDPALWAPMVQESGAAVYRDGAWLLTVEGAEGRVVVGQTLAPLASGRVRVAAVARVSSARRPTVAAVALSGDKYWVGAKPGAQAVGRVVAGPPRLAAVFAGGPGTMRVDEVRLEREPVSVALARACLGIGWVLWALLLARASPPHRRWVGLAVCFGVLGAGTLVPTGGLLGHALAFFAVGLWVSPAPLLLLAIAVEAAQLLVEGREASGFDLLADATGLAAALSVRVFRRARPGSGASPT